jgi:uncharacterized protein YyaL (SSP411 family)
LRRSPMGLSELLIAVDYRSDAVKQIVIVAPPGADLSAFQDIVRKTYLPNSVYVEAEEGARLTEIAKRIPLVASKIAIAGTTTAYVCEDTHCELPTGDPSTLSRGKPLMDALRIGFRTFTADQERSSIGTLSITHWWSSGEFTL